MRDGSHAWFEPMLNGHQAIYFIRNEVGMHGPDSIHIVSYCAVY